MEFIEINSPHIHRKRTSSMCMWHVIIALLPTTLCAVWYFGLPALAVIVSAIAACVASEWAVVRFMLGTQYQMSLTAAALTGLLLALNLPSGTPLWMVVAGSVFAIGIGKMAFGGLGCNIFNPALVGRVFMLISFPVAMTTWHTPGAFDSSTLYADGDTGATVLSALAQGTFADGQYSVADLFIGNMRGSLGEVASCALLLGFIYLLALKVISWHIPVAIFCTVAVLDLCLGVPPVLDIMAGGLMLGAIFMATDYVTSPMTHAGMLLYGVAIGAITVVIRRWGAYPEGMSFAILIMNGFTPLINRCCRPRRFGTAIRKEVVA